MRNKLVESFLYDSPIGVLEICLKNNQIYSISKGTLQGNKKNVYHFSASSVSCAKRKLSVRRISKSGNSDRHRNKKPVIEFEEQEKKKIENINQANKSREDKSREDKSREDIIQKIILFFDNYFSSSNSKPYSLDVTLFPRGTEFQRKVWRYLVKIPCGQTRTYAEVARVVGSPRATRAVGSACAKNPYLILVPCHRVVAQKSLGGFALGLPVKVSLLTCEKSLFR